MRGWPCLHHGQPALRACEPAPEHPQHAGQQRELLPRCPGASSRAAPTARRRPRPRSCSTSRARGGPCSASGRTGRRARSTRDSASGRNHCIGGSPSNARASASASRGTSSGVALRTAWPCGPAGRALPLAVGVLREGALARRVLAAVDRHHHPDDRHDDAAQHDPVRPAVDHARDAPRPARPRAESPLELASRPGSANTPPHPRGSAS